MLVEPSAAFPAQVLVKFAGVVFRISFFALLMSVDSSLDIENLCLFFFLAQSE